MKRKVLKFKSTIFEIQIIRKQPPEVLHRKKICSEKLRNTHRKTPASESFSNKVAGPKQPY